MEEIKNKTVRMETTQDNKEEKAQRKLTYEQLNEACNQLFQQNQQMQRRINELNTFNAFKRLDYLFKVVEYGKAFNDDEFVCKCLDEIKDAMLIKDTEEKTEE